MYLRLCALAAIGLLAAFTFSTLADPAQPTFQAGESAYIATKFDEARAIYRATAALPSAPADDRASSLRALAVMDWRLAGDNAAAEAHFNQALAVGHGLSRTHIQRARFFAATKRFDEAFAAAEGAIATAANATERRRGPLALALSVIASLAGTPIARQTPKDLERLNRARQAILGIGMEPPLPLEMSEALLEVALRLDDGALALEAWRSYAREGAEQGMWAEAGKRLGAAFPKLARRAPTPPLRAEIVEGLAASHFFELAVLVAQDARVADREAYLAVPRIGEIAAYSTTIAAMRTKTEAYYRDLTNGKGNAAVWRDEMLALGQELWLRLRFPGPPPTFTPEVLVAELDKRFGAYISIGRTGTVENMHAGHVFMDDARTIDQYSRKANLRRTVLDRMVSNGYESWVWDGRQAHGGWARADRVYQVRPGYVDSALIEWDRMTDPQMRAEEEESMARLTAGDDAIARRDPAVYLPGLAARLDWQGRQAIVDALKAKGVGPRDLKQRFTIDFIRIGLDANFFAHEGRHALDKQAYGTSLDGEELEFRAKLSEIAFSEQPRMSFGPIMNPNIADPNSPHGRANKRIMQALVAWMDKHRAAIKGLDPARPLLPQFDKLTDDQMREAMRSMDPAAEGRR